MSAKSLLKGEWSVLDVAISVGIVAIFTAVAVPMTRGALARRQTAECAEKLLWAADAFDLYAATTGEYPPDNQPPGTAFPCAEMIDTFSSMQIDWWGKSTEVGGVWDWFRKGEQMGYIAIAGTKAPENKMKRLDHLIDDGDLYNGQFRRYGPLYCYILKKQNYAFAGR